MRKKLPSVAWFETGSILIKEKRKTSDMVSKMSKAQALNC